MRRLAIRGLDFRANGRGGGGEARFWTISASPTLRTGGIARHSLWDVSAVGFMARRQRFDNPAVRDNAVASTAVV